MRSTTMNRNLISVLVAIVATLCPFVNGLNVVIAGGTGRMGQLVASKLSDHSVTILCRNSFLAKAPNRVSGDFGWVGAAFLRKHPHVSLRDYDGGDLLDIVGCDWIGWADDVLPKADVVVNVVGGYTQQRFMATERIVTESNQINRDILQITVSPREEDLRTLTPGATTIKTNRLNDCETFVENNCINFKCLRLEAFRWEENAQTIVDTILG